MNEIEVKLWAYIDGTCTAQEQQAIASLIEQDARYRSTYEELLALNAELQSIELDEPPMAFTYNVMETIRAEQARQPLKATINKNIIGILAGIFVIAMVLMVSRMLWGINWSAGNQLQNVTSSFKLPSVKSYMTAPTVKVFIFFDVLLALALFDSYLRKRRYPKQV